MPRAHAETAFRESLDRLGELQRADFAEIFRAMAGLPVTVRLLDPPLHEFLPVTRTSRPRSREAGDEGDDGGGGARRGSRSPASSRRPTRCSACAGSGSR